MSRDLIEDELMVLDQEDDVDLSDEEEEEEDEEEEVQDESPDCDEEALVAPAPPPPPPPTVEPDPLDRKEDEYEEVIIRRIRRAPPPVQKRPKKSTRTDKGLSQQYLMKAVRRAAIAMRKGVTHAQDVRRFGNPGMDSYVRVMSGIKDHLDRILKQLELDFHMKLDPVWRATDEWGDPVQLEPKKAVINPEREGPPPEPRPKEETRTVRKPNFDLFDAIAKAKEDPDPER